MQIVYQFPFSDIPEQECLIPEGSQILFVGLDQSFQPCVWIKGDAPQPGGPNTPLVYQTFLLVAAGEPLPQNAKKLAGSFEAPSGIVRVYTP